MNLRIRIAIDLGTTSVLVFSKSGGIILDEPSIVAVDRFTNKVVAVGDEAKKMLGRTPGHIVLIKPIEEGVIKDYEATERMLQYYIRKAVGKTLIKPNAVITVPSGSTQVQKRAVKQACLRAGSNDVYLIESPLAGALGSGIDISDNRGSLIINIGGGCTDVAIISKGGIVVSETIKVGGEQFDKDIIDYIRNNKNIFIGEKTAENIKLEIASINSNKSELSVNGRSIYNGVPEDILITSDEIKEAFIGTIKEISSAINRIIAKTPPELVTDIHEKGAILLGGSSLINGLIDMISEATKVKIKLDDDPLNTVIKGAGKSLSWMENLERIEDSKYELTRRILENNEELRRR